MANAGNPTPTKATKAWVGAAVAAAIAGLGALSTALDDNVVNSQEWVTIALATVVALAGTSQAVYWVSNKPKTFGE